MQAATPAQAGRPRPLKTTAPKWKERTANTHALHLNELKNNSHPPFEVCLLGGSIIEHWKDKGTDAWEGSGLASKWKVSIFYVICFKIPAFPFRDSYEIHIRL
jgi:hypothetical protein